MITRRLSLSLLILGISQTLFAQGMPIDSLASRISQELHNPILTRQLRMLIPNYEEQRVWGFATGDFSNDSLPDLALSLYSPAVRNHVHVYLLENLKNQTLVNRFDKMVPYVESPIEVGLTVEGSVVTIIQKTGEQHWSQQGYSIESGDVVLIDRFETEQEDVTGDPKAKQRAIGHEVYRNYESLRTRESYFTGSSGDAMFTSNYFTVPSYQRLRDIYPGYGRKLVDTTANFVLEGAGFRKSADDLSISSLQSAYDDQNLYLSLSVKDDYVVGGSQNPSANDRVSLWFDTKYTGDRLNRDRRLLSKKGGFPTFRDALDSLIYNITFGIPAEPGRITQISYSAVSPLTALEQSGLSKVRAQMIYDTSKGVVSGYTIRLKIPFAFLGFELNPAKLYEKPAAMNSNEEVPADNLQNGVGEAATFGFSALVYDVDDPSHANEQTVMGTSNYKIGNPSTFGTLILEPSSLYYGDVHPTYTKQVHDALASLGY